MSERPSIRDEPEDVVETPSDGIMVTLRGVNAALSAFVFAAPDSPLTLVGVGAGVAASSSLSPMPRPVPRATTTAATPTIAIATPRLTIVVRRNTATTSGDGDAICPHAIQFLRVTLSFGAPGDATVYQYDGSRVLITGPVGAPRVCVCQPVGFKV